MSTPNRIVHLHIPKTAGTALKAAFQDAQKDKARIFPHYDERLFAGVDPSRYDLFSGHIGFKTASSLGGKLVTVLRNPVDRFVSVYYFWRQLFSTNVENTINTRLASKFELEKFVELSDIPSLIEEFRNRITWQLATGITMNHRIHMRESGLDDSGLFALAKRNIEQFAVIGVQEDMSALAAKVKDVFSIDLNIRRVNVTDNRLQLLSIPTPVIRKIEDWMPLDMEIYRLVRYQLGG
jgi:Sulfotransferase family